MAASARGRRPARSALTAYRTCPNGSSRRASDRCWPSYSTGHRSCHSRRSSEAASRKSSRRSPPAPLPATDCDRISDSLPPSLATPVPPAIHRCRHPTPVPPPLATPAPPALHGCRHPDPAPPPSTRHLPKLRRARMLHALPASSLFQDTAPPQNPSAVSALPGCRCARSHSDRRYMLRCPQTAFR